MSNRPADAADASAADATRTPCSCGVVIALGVLFFCVFSLTGSKLQFGYEGQNIEQAEALLSGGLTPRPEGGILPFSKTGVLEVASYLPFAAVRLGLERAGVLWGFQQLVYVFVLPFYTTVLCLVFFGLARQLYRSEGTAVAVTLILGFGTLIWPYAKHGMETQLTLWTVAGVWALVAYAERPSARAAGWLGVAIAAVALTKISGLLHSLCLGGAALWLVTRRGGWGREGTARHAAVAGGWCVAGAVLLLATNRWRYGGWLWQGRYGFDAELWPMPLWEGVWAFLMSPNKSLFLFSPPLLIAACCLPGFWQRFPAMRAPLVLFGLLTLFHLRARTWADECWAARRLHFLVPLLALPIGLWWEGLRHSGRLRRWGGKALILAGLWVQVLGVSVDYTALAYTLMGTPTFSQENYLWDPQFNHLRFNLQLLRSAWSRAAGGESIPFVYRRHYLPVTRPETVPPTEIYPVEGLDQLDLWYVQQRADWPGRRYWFVSPSSWLFFGLLGGAIGAGLMLRSLLGRSRRRGAEGGGDGAGASTD